MISAIILAAGSSQRFGADNKLLADLNGEPLILHVVENIKNAGIGNIVVVTGFEADKVKNALAGQDVTFVSNPDYTSGIASSITAGIRALPADCDAVLIALGDMPNISPATIRALVNAFMDAGGQILVPVHNGKRGNPVLWHRDMFAPLLSISGDTGGRQVINQHPEMVVEVPVDDPGIHFDIDSKPALDGITKDA